MNWLICEKYSNTNLASNKMLKKKIKFFYRYPSISDFIADN